jgi:hypothetical protein
MLFPKTPTASLLQSKKVWWGGNRRPVTTWELSGCSSAWPERLLWEQEVVGSNPITPICVDGLAFLRGWEVIAVSLGQKYNLPAAQVCDYFVNDSDGNRRRSSRVQDLSSPNHSHLQ